MKTTVIFHSADFDGIFCREIARKFLPDAELIGWDFPDQPLAIPDGQIYVLDLPVDRVFGFDFTKPETQPRNLSHMTDLIWIDHHKSSIATHPNTIYGYRIDGVAACRLAWQWFTRKHPSPPYHLVDAESAGHLPDKEMFLEREVSEPLAVRLAGEYDVWDHRGDGDLEFQFGLRSRDLTGSDWSMMLDSGAYEGAQKSELIDRLLHDGDLLKRYQEKIDSDICKFKSFLVDFEGLKFLALNHARFNSNTFSAMDKPETGHDALLGFSYNGKGWTISLYHAKHRTELDLSEIAKRYGGGGHRGACGFQTTKLPFL